MTSSPELIHELRASRPSAPLELRARVREIAAGPPTRARWSSWRFPVRRGMLVAVPAAAALAFASAGVLGLARSDSPQAVRQDAVETSTLEAATQPAPSALTDRAQSQGGVPMTTDDRAQRVSAALTVEVKDSGAVSRAAQSALELTRSLGGFVVSSSVATGDEGSASITVRVPVDNVQDAIAGLSGLGRIVSQQVTTEDQQDSIDAVRRQARSLRAQIAVLSARLESEALDSETRARLEARLKNLKTDLLVARRNLGTLRAEARMSTVQLTVVTPGAFGAVAPPSRIDRTIDEALNVLAWEGVVALGLVIVLAPFALVAFAAWLGRRLYRRHEEERLLAA
jgi:Domain of unknown function (DUF4349)